MGVRLQSMDEAEYEAYTARMIPEYAKEGARATGMGADEALEYARRQIAALLPDGRRTAGQHFRSIVDGAGAAVGILWFAEQSSHDPPGLFVYDLVIEQAHRGEGLGSAALRALEEEAARYGAKAISLHVFASNEGAIRLYERLGYECTRSGEGGLQMTKGL